MNRIGLKINGIWCVLPQDVSISIEEQNPLFSDSGSFSYPIEMSVSQNRELFKSIDHPHGVIRPQDLDGLPFELWYDGVMLLYGSTETDEDLDIEEDKCSINLVSSNGDFQSRIDGLQASDVPLLDDIYLGRYYPGFTGKAKDEGELFGTMTDFEALLDPSNNMDYQSVNVSDPFPVKQYCNIRVCVKRKEKETDLVSPYQVLDVDRPWSSPCFYVAYFYKCLFAHLDYVVKEDHMCDVEDMKRLAFITTKCEHRLGEKVSMGKVDKIKVGKYVDAWLKYDDVDYVLDDTYNYPVYATEKNFPQTDVSSVLESMFNAFGLKVVANDKENTISVFYMRDILRDNEVIDASMKVNNVQVAYSKVTGVKMTYDGDEKDTAFNYKGYDVETRNVSYQQLMKTSLSAYDKKLYVVPSTGNKYRVKIDEDAEKEGDEDNLNPVLFEVAQFNDFLVGEESDSMEELSLSFTPLIENDIRSRYERYNLNSQTLALYVDGAEVDKPGEMSLRAIGQGTHTWLGGGHTWWVDLHQNLSIRYAEEQQDNPVTTHDCGFMLGVMRGPGNKSGEPVIQIENYDGNGNSAWVTVEDEYATTADTMDAYGNRYDYNGESDKDITEEGDNGIINKENSISLKTHIQTAQDLGLKDADGNAIDWGIDTTAAKRGLADRFMSEYMYFLLHRKTVSMDVDTTLSQLTSLSWFKQLRIADTVGRLKSRKYTLSNEGVSDMSIELYTIN